MHNMTLQLRGFDGAMHTAALPLQSLRHVQLHAYKKHDTCSRLALHDNRQHSFITSAGQTARLHPRSVRTLARVSPEDDSDEDLVEEWEEDDDGLDVEEFEDVTITTDVEGDGTIVWADYLANSVEGSTIAEIEAEDRLAGAVVNTSPLAASIAAAAAAAAAGESPITSDKVSQATSIVDPAVAAASASKFFEKDTLSLYPDQGPLSEWDLRAAMEKRRRMERERDEWLAKKEHKVGRYRAIASDWRNDVRIKDTGDPTQPNYREWSLREIWDLITMGGTAVDPRTLAFKVESPDARTDFVAEGFYQHPEVPEFLAMQGRLIEEDDEAEVVDADAEALLASEFSDLDDFSNDPLVDSTVDESF